MEEEQGKGSCIHPALLFLGGLVVLCLLGSFILSDKASVPESGPDQTQMATRPVVALGDEQLFLPPYVIFQVNQGAHAGGGWWYGRLAVDIGNGRGTPLFSPINGWVSEAGADEFGSTYIVLENSRWRVLMMHGDFSVGLGEVVQAGQQVGTESNNGFTRGPGGEICNGAPGCGEHTHLAVWEAGVEVDPLDLLR